MAVPGKKMVAMGIVHFKIIIMVQHSGHISHRHALHVVKARLE